MKKQPEVTEATRNALISAFCSFYIDRPVERITVKEVADKAGYSRATYYKYFSDNYALLDYIEQSMIADVLKRVSEGPIDAHWDETFVEAFTQVVNAKRSYIAILAGPTGTSHFSNKLKQEAAPLLMAALGIAANDSRARLTLEFYLSGMGAMFGSWLTDNRGITAEELGALVHGILREGVLAQIGL